MKTKDIPIEQFPIDKIKADKNQPRRSFKNIKELADDIEIHSLLHNIAINGGNKIIYGERRWRACKMLGWKTIPVKRYKHEITPLERIELQLVENSSREDLPIIDKARTYETFLNAWRVFNAALKTKKEGRPEEGYTSLAKIENCSVTNIKEVLSLLETPKPIQEALNEGIVRVSHIVEAMKIKDDSARKEVLNRIMKESTELTKQVKELNREYDQEMDRIAKEKKELEEKAKREAKKRQEQLRFLEKQKIKAKKEEKKRLEQEQKRKIKEAKEAKIRADKERIRLEKEATQAKKKKQEAERAAKEKRDIIQSKQESRGIAKISNNPKISNKIKEAVAKGIIKIEQVTDGFDELDEEEQRSQLAEMIRTAQEASGKGTKKRIELEKFLKKNKELMKVPEEADDEDEKEFRDELEDIELELLPRLTEKLLFNLTEDNVSKWMTRLRKVKLYSQLIRFVEHAVKVMNFLDQEFDYELEKTKK